MKKVEQFIKQGGFDPPLCIPKLICQKGDKGDKGDKGCKGDKGDRGEKGEAGDSGYIYLDAWNASREYPVKINKSTVYVKSGNCFYECLIPNKNSNPSSSPSFWKLIYPL